MADASQVVQWRGSTVVGSDGEKIGRIEEIYLDTETERPEWALIHTGLFGTKSSFMPLEGATSEGDQVRAPYTKDQVKGAPSIDADGELSQDGEEALYRHYGLGYGEARSDTGLPQGTGTTTGRTSAGVVGDDVSGRETDDAMTRSEEEVRVGTRQRETGRMRLRKYIVSEPVQETVTTRREEARIEREPITDANIGDATSGPELSEEEHEVTLRAEEPVVQKQVVPKERVRLDKDTITEQRTVTEEARKEQIDLVDAEGRPAEGADGRRGTDEGIR